MLNLVADAALTDISNLITAIVRSGEREIVISLPEGGFLFRDLQDLFDFELLQGMSQSLDWEVTLETESLLLAELARAFGLQARVLENEMAPEPRPEDLWPGNHAELLSLATPATGGFCRIQLNQDFASLEQLFSALLVQWASGLKDFLLLVPFDSPLFKEWQDFLAMQALALEYRLNVRFESFLPTFILMANTAGFYVTQQPRLQSATILELKAYAEIMRLSEYSSLQRLADVIEPSISLIEEGYLEEANRWLNDQANPLVHEFYADPANRIRFAPQDLGQPEEGLRLLNEVKDFAGNHFDSRYRPAS